MPPNRSREVGPRSLSHHLRPAGPPDEAAPADHPGADGEQLCSVRHLVSLLAAPFQQAIMSAERKRHLADEDAPPHPMSLADGQDGNNHGATNRLTSFTNASGVTSSSRRKGLGADSVIRMESPTRWKAMSWRTRLRPSHRNSG